MVTSRLTAVDSYEQAWDNDFSRGHVMPRQEIFFEEQTGDRRVEVLKTYDRSYAREVFNGIDSEAREALAKALELEKNFEPSDISIYLSFGISIIAKTPMP
jgi:hypothetical protein